MTVDRALVEVATASVAAGRADSLSAWVNRALVERAEKERRLAAMAEAIAAYERRFGAISADEMRAQERADRQAAVVVRGVTRRPRKRRRRVA